MTNTTTQLSTASEKRTQISFGITLLVVGLGIFLLFGLNTEAGTMTTFGLNLAGSQAIEVPDFVVPAQTTVYLMAAIAVFAGAFQLARGVRNTCLSWIFEIMFIVW